MFTVYIIRSKKNGKYYIGHTSDITRRLHEHNSGLTYSTKNHVPWEIVFTREFKTKSMAQHIELKIKKMKSRVFIEKLINGQVDDTFFL